MFDQIAADYDRLAQLANRFSQQAQVIQATVNQIEARMNQLQGEWIGRGSDAFFAEMEGEIAPATGRLIEALAESGRAAQSIVRLMEQADEEASAPLRTFV